MCLLDEGIHKNIKEGQLRNGLAPSESLGSMDFTVESDRIDKSFRREKNWLYPLEAIVKTENNAHDQENYVPHKP